MNEPRLYWNRGCQACKLTANFFDRNGVSYKHIDIENHPGAYEVIMKLGYSQLPVVIHHSIGHFSGFRPDLLAKICAKIQDKSNGTN